MWCAPVGAVGAVAKPARLGLRGGNRVAQISVEGRVEACMVSGVVRIDLLYYYYYHHYYYHYHHHHYYYTFRTGSHNLF